MSLNVDVSNNNNNSPRAWLRLNVDRTYVNKLGPIEPRPCRELTISFTYSNIGKKYNVAERTLRYFVRKYGRKQPDLNNFFYWDAFS